MTSSALYHSRVTLNAGHPLSRHVTRDVPGTSQRTEVAS